MKQSYNEITKQLDNLEQKLEIIKLTLEFDADREKLSIHCTTDSTSARLLFRNTVSFLYKTIKPVLK